MILYLSLEINLSSYIIWKIKNLFSKWKMKSKNFFYVIFVQALLAMSWSLYFSNFGDPVANIMNGHVFGGIGFEPCHLCRWTRILMYPLVWISLIWIIRKDKNVIYTVLPISIAWIILTTYHYSIQYLNSLNVLSCAPGNPCTLIDWKIFGFITIPALALIAFMVIAVSSIIIIKNNKK